MLKKTDDGVILPVKVTPKAVRNEITGWQNEELCVRLKAIPEKGEANDSLIRFLAKELGLSRSQLQLTHGQTSRHKRLCISGITVDQLERQILSL